MNELYLTAANHSELCRMAHDIVDTVGFVVLVVLEVVLGVAGLIGNCLVFYAVWNVTLFHFSLRLLLSHFSFSLFLYSGVHVVKAGRLMHKLSLRDSCAFVIGTHDCHVEEIMFNISVQLVVYAELVLVMERLISTVFYEHYDGSRLSQLIGLVLAPLAYVIPLINLINAVSQPNLGQMMPLCESLLAMNSSAATSTLAVNTAAVLICVVCVTFVHYQNFNRLQAIGANRAKHTLAIRFQIHQNIKINRILVPDIILELIFYLPNYVFLLLVVIGLPLPHNQRALLVHVNHVWKLLYASAHPFVTVKRNVNVRQKLRRLMPEWCARFRKDRVHTIDVRKASTVDHFRMLEQAWNRAKF